MTGPEHYKAAEALLANLRREVSSSPGILLYTPEQQVRMIAEAQVHATLALAAPTEAKAGFVITEDDVMRCAHGAIICGLCGFGVNAGDGGRS